jgi:hypothetical protein
VRDRVIMDGANGRVVNNMSILKRGGRRRKYPEFGIYTLGKMVTENIREYSNNREQKILSKIFPMLIEIGERILYTRYRTDFFVLEDATHQIAEDILLYISKDPNHYLYIDNFYPYYKRAIICRAGQILKDFFNSFEHSVSLDYSNEIEISELCSIMPSPIDLLIKKEDHEILVNRIYQKLKSCYRFSRSFKYLVWPMVVSILYQDNTMFDSLDFRDRVALKVMRNTLLKKNYLHA